MKLSAIILLIIVLNPFLSFCQKNEFADTLSPDKAILNFKSILKRNKHSSYALYGLAATYFIKKDYRLALKFSKDNVNSLNDYQAESYILYASSLDRMSRLSEAISVYEKAIKNYPGNYQLWYEYSLSCYKDRNFKKSIPAIRKVIELQPLFIPAHFLYGCLLFESSNDPRCISAFLYALLLDNDSLRSQQGICFVEEYLKQNMNSINIPFLDTRLAINTTDNILFYYISEQTKKDIYTNSKFENLCGTIEDFLSSTKDYTDEYQSFYLSLKSDSLDNAFSHYLFRMTDNEYLKNWYKSNSKLLNKFGEFLDKNLPGK